MRILSCVLSFRVHAGPFSLAWLLPSRQTRLTIMAPFVANQKRSRHPWSSFPFTCVDCHHQGGTDWVPWYGVGRLGTFGGVGSVQRRWRRRRQGPVVTLVSGRLPVPKAGRSESWPPLPTHPHAAAGGARARVARAQSRRVRRGCLEPSCGRRGRLDDIEGFRCTRRRKSHPLGSSEDGRTMSYYSLTEC